MSSRLAALRPPAPPDWVGLLHAAAFITAAVWGSTFISTKVLITCGLLPEHIFALRFLIAYVPLLLLCHKPLRAATLSDELLFLCIGLTGGSIYFLTENYALRFSTATNVSLIVCSCPLATTILYRLVVKGARLSRGQAIGALLAFSGMVAVVLNGHFVLHLSPLGDALALAACLCWAVYSVLMERIGDKYSAAFITRKTFFYGLITTIPYYLIARPELPKWELLLQPTVAANMLFLALIASLLCFYVWAYVIERLGSVVTTNYVYVNPLATIVVARLVLSERITPWFAVGTILILAGMYLSNRHKHIATM